MKDSKGNHRNVGGVINDKLKLILRVMFGNFAKISWAAYLFISSTASGCNLGKNFEALYLALVGDNCVYKIFSQTLVLRSYISGQLFGPFFIRFRHFKYYSNYLTVNVWVVWHLFKRLFNFVWAINDDIASFIKKPLFNWPWGKRWQMYTILECIVVWNYLKSNLMSFKERTKDIKLFKSLCWNFDTLALLLYFF